MAHAQVVVYEHFRLDVYLVKNSGDFSKNPVIATFSTPQLAADFAKWYVTEHTSGQQLCINDLKTAEIKYVGERKEPVQQAWQPREAKVVSISKPANDKKHAHVEEEEPVTSTVSTSTLSKRDLAIALLKVIKESKPLPARKVAEKAGVPYDIDCKRVLRELGGMGKIVFDNGRWRRP